MLNKKLLAVVVASSTALYGCNSDNDTQVAEVTVNLRIIETSDLHTNIMDFNYYNNQQDPTIGLARAASLIAAARDEVTNAVLVDNGDLLQGSPMGDYIASVGLSDTHPAYKAMNTLDYEVGNIGNHEFNYGLDFLETAIAGANFPYISANVICANKEGCWGTVQFNENMFKPYLIKETSVVDTQGNSQTLNIGYIGFVPPQILQWDKAHLTGEVEVLGIIQSAKKFVPEMKAAGADLIVAIPHSGIGSSENPGDPWAENATFALTSVADIDAIMFGHSHSVFPAARYSDLPNTDVEKGLLNGIPAVMPGRWGDNIGIVDLQLSKKGNYWIVDHSAAQTEARPVYDNTNKVELVSGEQSIRDAVALEHQGTVEFVSQPIGVAASDMFSFLTLVQDDPSVQIVSLAQIAGVKAKLPDNLSSLPILSASAPFKAGGRYQEGDASQFVMVPAGPLSYSNAADLYLYPNTMVVLKATGAELKDWLECSANQFNQIDPSISTPQNLINRDGHPTYNFDVIDGLNYKIDVTQPSKFDRNCEVVNATANRIVELSYTDEMDNVISGEDLAAKEFLVASNNYRAFGGAFAGTGTDHVVLELPDTNREALAAYISEQSQPDGSGGYASEVDPTADYNWDFKTITATAALDVRFETQDSELADTFIANNQQRTMEKLTGVDAVAGFAIYRIDLTSEPVRP
ncbi:MULTISPECIES: bifunctional 2',3'-cyclic-nucleotide 2'-phosphodiesterase/3'-nucleotidase [unclassified Agarivorans]|uniref:bifunctional 2',3'-cyclic-nucleotide 2'-phosphodiesterase/3'-nucleotidase n=1 Tax=unclassified Agarivorans TaxID=2636026 RepID=UPI0026E3E8BF|nr:MULTISPECIES: bifunctional 2',3'-cyclic-nucleotide 2'-phosphodiesterase/3'-nucleotidase [unclassified Agarivorans]MDO6687027.1 bifunctional 2',3'-cyclic-nucleotide 2'-phosphodiesterase/3'-nucleotidase [Agarivorans sp. 3_MG-2023]MDO6713561.1 bifunctional 2',3'-cyclic-nucleotide 2'-phosphodiesterase/3'-nucleotidase [Agarivorans sp. 2_MG-2023]